MALRSDWSEALCPVGRSLDVLGDPWVLLIVRDVLHGHGRFDTLRENLRISEAVLSRRLHSMVEAGLLERVDYQDGARTRQGYAATEAAADLLPILQQLVVWGEKHTTMPTGGAHMPMIHDTCGQETTQGEVCSSCGEVLVSEAMTWVKPWKVEKGGEGQGGQKGTREKLQPAGTLV
ncbi:MULTISPECIES: winged helix-turn-helix transcriptional regulator [Brevibacterium]|uniref:Helix-turn-helix transcriptional regulator n=3 Tax=Brevibacterium TaxID=1696 RepID=A0A556CDD3_BREAU|nr:MULTISPECIES: helix-turn-helix domain-containing protein [Brevibacterium]TSI15462.1 helix-turn-helix transcriptional regulator [Brevibacterium aurantiacum]SDS38577.1 DNA-binding transcriptional regulator, HxlR family [Brevibacterium sandarakinum]